MPRATVKRPTSQGGYWDKRLGSRAFSQALTDALARELRLLAQARVADVLDPEWIRAAIRGWDTRLIDRARLAELVVAVHRRATGRLRRRRESLLDVLDRQLVADFETLLAAGAERTEAFVGDLMRQEFVRRLFTDIIFTAIVSFNQKVNPLFGGLTMRVLEDQIKGFIRMFMPMLLEQATAFVVNPDNQRIGRDFTREVMRQLLDQPLHAFAVTAAPAQRRQVEAAIRRAVRDARLDAVIREAALATWDDLYGVLREQRVGEVIRLDEQADWLAEQCVRIILPVLARPEVVRLIASEAARAARLHAAGSPPQDAPTEGGNQDV
jgi:hypothetical protein